MTINERKSMLVGAIRKFEDKIIILAHCEADCDKALSQRDAEIETLQRHLHQAHDVLVILNEEELKEAS